MHRALYIYCAGNGSPVIQGDGGPATTKPLNNPVGVGAGCKWEIYTLLIRTITGFVK